MLQCLLLGLLHSGTFEWTTLLDTTSAHDSEHECIMITQRRARFVPYNLCASRPSTTSTTCSSLSTASHIVLSICPDHLPRHEFRARLQARVHCLPVRAHCLLLPERQQTSHTTNGLLMRGSHHPPHPPSCSASARQAQEPCCGPTSARRVQAGARVGHTKTHETHGLSGQ